MTEHTPTPWKHEGLCVDSADGKMIAACFFENISAKSANANAAFIVKACSSHDALVKALLVAKHQLILLGGDHRPYPDYPTSDQLQGAVLDQIDAALASLLSSKECGVQS